MKQLNAKRLLAVVTVIALVGIGSTAFAGWGRGFHASGMHGRGWGGYGQPYWATSLSEEDQKKLEASREAFFKDTEDLRRRIYEKQLALQSEMIQANPDSKKAAEVQKELSELQSQFDQKRLQRRLDMQKQFPDAGRGYMGRGGMGGGYMGPGSMGRGYMGGGMGGYGYGPDNCPFR